MVSDENAIDAGLRALSDSTRRDILSLLKKGQLSVLEIAERFPMSRPAISKHLRILKEAGMVLETPAGRQRLYTLELSPLVPLQAWLAGFNGYGGSTRGADAIRRRRRSVPTEKQSSSSEDWRVW
jgi:DNA-binding transcriptional ArsR family regulator